MKRTVTENYFGTKIVVYELLVKFYLIFFPFLNF